MARVGKGWVGLLALTCVILLSSVALALATCAQHVLPSPERDARWAEPLERPGLPNLHKVSDGLYRGAQPTAEGFRQLQAMGVRTVVNLRSFHSDRDEMGDADLQYEQIPMKAWHAEDEDVVRFLQIVSEPVRAPVFVHCKHGSDRTGVIVATYRIAVQGWTVEDAAEEMRCGGYGFHEAWEGSLPEYLEGLDFAEIMRQVRAGEGAEAPAEGQ